VGGDGEGTEEENEGDRLPPHVRSPSTFQPCLCPWLLGREVSLETRLVPQLAFFVIGATAAEKLEGTSRGC